MANRILRTKLTIDGESEYRSAISKINSQLKNLQSELKLTTSQYQTNANSLEALSAKNTALIKVQETEKKKVEELQKILGSAKTKVSELKDEKARLEERIRSNNEALAKLKKTTGDTTKEEERLKNENQDLQAAVSKVDTAIERAEKKVNDYGTQLNYAQIKVNDLDAELQKNDKYLDEASKSADGCAHSIDEFGNEVHEASDEVKTMATILSSQELKEGMDQIVTTLADCVSAFSDYEDGLARVRATTGMSEDEAKALGERFQKLSTEIPVTTTQMLELASAAGQYGVTADQIESFTLAMSRLASANKVPVDSISTLMAQFSNITGEQDFERLASVITKLNNNSATGAVQIVEMSQRMAAAGKQAGMTAQDILGISAAVTSLGQGSQAGGTAMQRLISQISRAVETGKNLDTFASVSGMSAGQFKKAWGDDAVGALQSFITGLADTERNGKSAIALFDDLGISQENEKSALIGLSTAEFSLSDAIDMVNQEWDDNKALTEASSIANETLSAQMGKLDNATTNLKTAIGEVLAPSLEKAAGGATNLVNRVTDFVRAHPELTKALSLIAGSLATVTTGIASAKAAWKVADFLGMTKPLKAVAEAAAAAGGGITGISAALGAVATSAGIAGSVLLSVVTIIDRCKDLKEIGFLGEGHTLEEYAENVESYKKRIEDLQVEYDNLVACGGDLTMVMDAQGLAQEGLRHATEEYNAALEAAAQAEEEVAQASDDLSESYSAQSYTLDDAKIDLQNIAQAYRDAYDAAQSSLGGQIGLFDSYAKSIDESTDTAAKLLEKWGEQTQNLGEYTENLKKAANLGLDEGLLKALADGSPEAAGYLSVILDEVNKADQGISQFGNNAKDVVDAFNAEFQRTEEAKEALSLTMAGINSGLAETLKTIQTQLGEDTSFEDYVAACHEAFATVGIDFQTDGKNVVLGVIAGVDEQKAEAVQAIQEVAEEQNQAFEQEQGINSPSRRYQEYGTYMVQGLANGISSTSPMALNTIRSLVSQLNDAVSGLPSQMQYVGQGIIDGMIQGLNNRESALYSTVRNIVSYAISIARQEAGVASPSKKTREIFEHVGEGMVVGIESKSQKVSAATKDVVMSALQFDQQSIRQMSAAISGSIPDFDRLTSSARNGAGGNSAEKNDNRQITINVENHFNVNHDLESELQECGDTIEKIIQDRMDCARAVWG